MKNSIHFNDLLNSSKKLSHILYTALLTLAMVFNAESQEILEISDFELLNNTSWTGQLTYKDYQSGEQTSIDATMQITINDDKIISSIQYTYEPNKNNKSSVKLKKNGTYFGNEKVLSNSFENGTRTIVTTYDGRDDGKKATMYITRILSEQSYQVTKEVQLENTKEHFIRNTYKFTKL